MAVHAMPTTAARTRGTLVYVAAGAIAAAGLLGWGVPHASAAPQGCPDVEIVYACNTQASDVVLSPFGAQN